jgi:hypothetical protein
MLANSAPLSEMIVIIFKKTREIFKKRQNYVFIELHPKSGKKVEEKGC